MVENQVGSIPLTVAFVSVKPEKGWSREKLAFESGLNRTYLSAFERSERNISLDNVARISKALEIPASELLNELAKSQAS